MVGLLGFHKDDAVVSVLANRLTLTPLPGTLLAAKACNHHEPWQRRVAQLAWERKLLAICRPFLSDPSAVQAKLCRRIERHIKELFVFVAEPDVPSDNNPAERSRRHLVISRKISGGTRSEQGTERKMTLASLFGTWRAQGLNPLAACRQLLVSLDSELLPEYDHMLISTLRILIGVSERGCNSMVQGSRKFLDISVGSG